MTELKTFGLFALTALAEIAGCYLPYLWLREGKSIWLLVPGVLSLVAFVWLLSLHPAAAVESMRLMAACIFRWLFYGCGQ
ncbi:hypothetical protein JCM18902_1936 [Psychrobacter sp. JCM 18902]|nr:hypothetical protein JCM18902_1936 [Psychrobacter sp. JCM 18902]